MKILSRLSLITTLLVLALPVRAAGFEPIEIPLADGQKADGGVWYPSPAPQTSIRLGPFTIRVARGAEIAGERLPLVVISHGTGGWFGGHHDTAAALADAGFVVAAITHPGDNVQDQSGLIGQKRFLDRPRQLASLIDYVTERWRGAGRVDATRIALFGYSAGGTAAVTAAGGKPDFSRLRPHCQQVDDPVCPLLLPQWTALEGSTVPASERKFQAMVLAAPALGMLFDKEAVADLTMLVQVWQAGRDELLASPYHAERFARILPGRTELHTVPEAGHYAFLPPCPDDLTKVAPEVCRDAGGFDRARFHDEFNRAVVRFLSENLKP